MTQQIQKSPIYILLKQTHSSRPSTLTIPLSKSPFLLILVHICALDMSSVWIKVCDSIVGGIYGANVQSVVIIREMKKLEIYTAEFPPTCFTSVASEKPLTCSDRQLPQFTKYCLWGENSLFCSSPSLSLI